MNHWQRYAGHWGKVASPLTPNAQDLDVYARELDAHAPTLLLGVTPQIAALELRGTAVDRSAAMIAAHPPAPGRWRVLQADWRALPLAEGAVAQVVGDGVLSMLAYPQDYEVVLQELRRVLQPGGKCVLRLFVPPRRPESAQEIAADVAAGRLGSFHALKWRLMMSLCQTHSGHGVRVADGLALFNETFADRDALLRLTGWSAEVFDTMDVYRNSDVELSFVPRAELDTLFQRFAAQVRYSYGAYELAERCPVLVLEDWQP